MKLYLAKFMLVFNHQQFSLVFLGAPGFGTQCFSSRVPRNTWVHWVGLCRTPGFLRYSPRDPQKSKRIDTSPPLPSNYQNSSS